MFATCATPKRYTPTASSACWRRTGRRFRDRHWSAPPEWDVADYVLSKFKKDEQPEIDAALDRAAEGVAAWTKEGLDYCMTQYNAK